MCVFWRLEANRKASSKLIVNLVWIFHIRHVLILNWHSAARSLAGEFTALQIQKPHNVMCVWLLSIIYNNHRNNRKNSTYAMHIWNQNLICDTSDDDDGTRHIRCVLLPHFGGIVTLCNKRETSASMWLKCHFILRSQLSGRFQVKIKFFVNHSAQCCGPLLVCLSQFQELKKKWEIVMFFNNIHGTHVWSFA